MAEPPKETSIPTDPSIAPQGAAEGAGEDGATTSKKGAKKAEAKAKKEAEKARKAAEREAAAAASSSAASEDLAKENYGDITHTTKLTSSPVHLRELGEEHVGKTVKLRAWIQNARMQGAKMAFVRMLLL